MVYLDQILHKYACQHSLTTGMCDSLFFDGRGFAEPVCISVALDPHGIFGSNFAYLCILKLTNR